MSTGAPVPIDRAGPPIAEIERRARLAQLRWAARSSRERAAVLRRFRAAIVDAASRVVETISAETGKPAFEGYAVELSYVLEAITYWTRHAERLLSAERVRPRLLRHKRVWSRWVPCGVAGVVSPWNFPFAIPIGDAIPALVAGNAVIVKPSELTPRSALLAAELWKDAGLPDDLLQIAVGAGDVGAALVERADVVMFTGSVATGRGIAARCGELLKPCALELGGKDPMIVCADADLERASSACVWGALVNSGQACLSVERVYVEAPVYDAFLGLLEAKVIAVRQGLPGARAEIGPMISERQLQVAERHVRDALERGAKATVGGARGAGAEGWFFFQPTILVDVTHEMCCMREETFGPTIPVMRVDSLEEAIRLANDSEYGLGASVFTRDAEKGLRAARQLEAGSVCVNDCLAQAFVPNAPMGGWKASGLGRRHGAEGIRKYCRQQTILADRLGLRAEPYWFPWSERKEALLRRVQRLLYRGRLA